MAECSTGDVINNCGNVPVFSALVSPLSSRPNETAHVLRSGCGISSIDLP